MKEIIIKNTSLCQAAQQGMDNFLRLVIDSMKDAIGGQLTADTMSELSADQITLLAYDIMREEMLDGGFVELIHNGYGAFIFLNPFAKALKVWGIRELAKVIYKAHTLYNKHHESIEVECTDDEFMAMFEKYPDFDELDDMFMENDDRWHAMVSYYVDEHIADFVKVDMDN